MPNVMAALPNIGGALCSTPQTLADAHYKSAVQKRCQYRRAQDLDAVNFAPDKIPLCGKSPPKMYI